MIEYRKNSPLLSTRLDSGVRLGTYGAIQITLFIENRDGKLYHPIDNSEEASWWLNYYKSDEDTKRCVFIPAPDQKETGQFVEPVFSEETDENPPNETPWQSREYDEYS